MGWNDTPDNDKYKQPPKKEKKAWKKAVELTSSTADAPPGKV